MRRFDVDPSELDEHGALRVGFVLWVVMVFLSRHALLLVLGAVSNLIGARGGLDADTLTLLYSRPGFVPASLPAIAVLIAALRRRPQALRPVRALWRSGRWLLVAAAILDLAVLGFYGSRHGFIVRDLHVAGAVADGYTLMYLARSARARAVFADFPAAADTGPGAGGSRGG